MVKQSRPDQWVFTLLHSFCLSLLKAESNRAPNLISCRIGCININDLGLLKMAGLPTEEKGIVLKCRPSRNATEYRDGSTAEHAPTRLGGGPYCRWCGRLFHASSANGPDRRSAPAVGILIGNDISVVLLRSSRGPSCRWWSAQDLFRPEDAADRRRSIIPARR